MKKHILFNLLLVMICIAGSAKASDEKTDTVGSKYIKGSLVQYLLPTERRYDFPVILIHGHNLSSYTYATTPDGRDGWAQMFSDDGYDVYMVNDPKFDFATGGFSVEPFTQVPTEGQPSADSGATLPWQSDIWKRWGFGSKQGVPYDNARFPTDSFENFSNNYPYVSKSSYSYAEAVTALVDSLQDSVILLAHSAGGPVALQVAHNCTEKVKAIIYIEPTGPPTEDDFPALAGLSMLGVYGDYIDSRRQGSRKEGTEAAANLFAENGGEAKVISLPDDYDIYGNSHLMSQDNNNDFIYSLISDWIEQIYYTNTSIRAVPKQSLGLEITPNPVSHSKHINIKLSSDNKGMIKIYQMNGVLIDEGCFEPSHGVAVSYDVSLLKKGMYLLEIQVGAIRELTKLIII